MACRCLPLPLTLAILFVLAATPASASLALSTVSFAPVSPLEPGGNQHVSALFAVIPAGSSTFAPDHSLQMQTDLAGASWNIQVTLDGRDAARQTASGAVAFVNGEILSYPTTRDVGIVVTIDGTVPAESAGQLTALSVKELDNGGNSIPGSDVAIVQPVAGRNTPGATTPLPTLTSPPAATTPPQGSPGFAAFFTVIALAAAGFVMRTAGWER